MSGVEILDNGTRVLTAPRAAFGTDALLLGRFAQPRRAYHDWITPNCGGWRVVTQGSEPITLQVVEALEAL